MTLEAALTAEFDVPFGFRQSVQPLPELYEAIGRFLDVQELLHIIPVPLLREYVHQKLEHLRERPSVAANDVGHVL